MLLIPVEHQFNERGGRLIRGLVYLGCSLAIDQACQGRMRPAHAMPSLPLAALLWEGGCSVCLNYHHHYYLSSATSKRTNRSTLSYLELEKPAFLKLGHVLRGLFCISKL